MNSILKFETDDMGLVTFLRVNGCTPAGCTYVGSVCTWSFESSDELTRLVGEFEVGVGTVPAKEYNRLYKETRGEFYKARDDYRASAQATG